MTGRLAWKLGSLTPVTMANAATSVEDQCFGTISPEANVTKIYATYMFTCKRKLHRNWIKRSHGVKYVRKCWLLLPPPYPTVVMVTWCRKIKYRRKLARAVSDIFQNKLRFSGKALHSVIACQPLAALALNIWGWSRCPPPFREAKTKRYKKWMLFSQPVLLTEYQI